MHCRLRPPRSQFGHEQTVATVGFRVRYLVLSRDAGRRPLNYSDQPLYVPVCQLCGAGSNSQNAYSTQL